jgi:hypothetical protein
MKRLVAASKLDTGDQNQRWKKGGIMKIRIFLISILAFFISQTAHAKTLYYDITWESPYSPLGALEIKGVLSSKGDLGINSWTIDGVDAYEIIIDDSTTTINYLTEGDYDFNVAEIWLPQFTGYFEGFDFFNDAVYSGFGSQIIVEDPNSLLTLDNIGNYLPIISQTGAGPHYFHRIYGYEEWGPIVTISGHKMNAPVPEPATMLLVGVGVTGLVGMRLRKKQ